MVVVVVSALGVLVVASLFFLLFFVLLWLWFPRLFAAVVGLVFGVGAVVVCLVLLASGSGAPLGVVGLLCLVGVVFGR